MVILLCQLIQETFACDVCRVCFTGDSCSFGQNNELVLKEDTELLDEVVVVGYGTQKKVNLTGAVSAVTSEDLMNKPVMSTAQAIRFGTRSECCTEFWTSWYRGKCEDSWNRYFLQCRY